MPKDAYFLKNKSCKIVAASENLLPNNRWIPAVGGSSLKKSLVSAILTTIERRFGRFRNSMSLVCWS